MALKPLQLTAANDDNYFVFEDVILQVLLCFSRDTDVLKGAGSRQVMFHICTEPRILPGTLPYVTERRNRVGYDKELKRAKRGVSAFINWECN